MRHIAVVILLMVIVIASDAPGQTHASSYVPMDDWAYPVLDRMIARGELDVAGTGIRPWTRLRIGELLERCTRCEGPDFEALRSEFSGAPNSDRVRLDSIYLRPEQIIGTPLTNGFDYGQTIMNDFGRPNREGHNLIVGLQAHSDSRWMASAVRLEYQHSGAESLDSRQLVASLDGAATVVRRNPSSLRQVRIIEGYVGTRIANLSVTVGKQDVHWGR